MTAAEIHEPGWPELLERFRQDGDAQSFEALVTPWLPAIRRMILMSSGRQSALFEEIQQEVLLSLMAGLRRFRGESTFSTFLFTIVRHRTLDVLKREGRHRKRQSWQLDGLDLDHLADQRMLDPAGLLERRETETRLAEELARLTELDRLIVQLRLIEELGEQETAQILDLSGSAVRSRLHRARRCLQKRLADQWRKHE